MSVVRLGILGILSAIVLFSQPYAGVEKSSIQKKLQSFFHHSHRVTQTGMKIIGNSNSWSAADWSFITMNGADWIDDFTEFNSYPSTIAYGWDFPHEFSAFNGLVCKRWNNWSTLTVREDSIRVKYTFDAQARITSSETNDPPFKTKIGLSYNDLQNTLKELSFFFFDPDQNTWLEILRFQYLYNSNNKISQIIAFKEGLEVGSYLFTYDANNYIIAEEAYNVGKAQKDSVLTSKITYSWANNYVLLEMIQYEDTSFYTGSLPPIQKDTLLFDKPGGKMTKQITLLWNDSLNSWKPDSKDSLAYTANGDFSSVTEYKWNGTTGAFLEYAKYDFSYNTDNTCNNIVECSWDNAWVNEEKVVYTYQNNAITKGNIYYWNFADSTWLDSEIDTYAYDDRNGPKEYTFEQIGNKKRYQPTTYTIDIEYNSSIKNKGYTGIPQSNITVQSSGKAILFIVRGKPLKGDGLRIFDLSGRKIADLRPVSDRQETAVYRWDYSIGKAPANKVYFILLRKGNETASLRFVL